MKANAKAIAIAVVGAAIVLYAYNKVPAVRKALGAAA